MLTLCHLWLSQKIIAWSESWRNIMIFLRYFWLFRNHRRSLAENLNFTWLTINRRLRSFHWQLSLSSINNWLMILRCVYSELLISLLKGFQLLLDQSLFPRHQFVGLLLPNQLLSSLCDILSNFIYNLSSRKNCTLTACKRWFCTKGWQVTTLMKSFT